MPSGRNGTIGRKKRLRGIVSVVGLRRRSLTPRLCRSHQLITPPGLILTCADAGPTPHLAGSCRVSPYSLQAISGRRRAGIPKSLLGGLFTFAPLIASFITERPASLPCVFMMRVCKYLDRYERFALGKCEILTVSWVWNIRGVHHWDRDRVWRHVLISL